MIDRRILYAAAFLRALATGMIGVLLGVYLGKLKLDAAVSGLVIGAGLAGVATAALLATLAGDRLGPKRFLMSLGLLAAAGGTLFALTKEPAFMAGAAFLGMVNGMGRDRGAALILEQALLPGTTSDDQRTRVFAVYNILQDVGHALGALMATLPTYLDRFGVARPFQASILVYSGIMAATVLLYMPLRVAPRAAIKAPVTPESRRILWKICPLFAMDSLGGGFLTSALLSYFFYERFGVDQASLGPLFFGARALNAASHVGAAWLAKRIGLVNTMVFTHIPSSLLLLTVPFAPTFWIAAVLFLLREGLVEMDVPTRQSYVMAVVRPEERTFASGVTNLVRVGAWAVAPGFAGLFIRTVTQAAPLFIGAGLKIVYDIALYAAFRRLKPPEERSVS
jgi:MFS family permease